MLLVTTGSVNFSIFVVIVTKLFSGSDREFGFKLTSVTWVRGSAKYELVLHSCKLQSLHFFYLSINGRKTDVLGTLYMLKQG